VDTVLSGLFKKFDDGTIVHLVLPNPDLIYPKADQGFGIASASIALILEAALQRRYPARPELKFARLRKPHAAIFKEILERSGTRDMVMIGDQLETDIRGVIEFGLDAALVGIGITNMKLNDVDKSLQPTYYLDSLIL
jgi:ribonucleotide monophosphatase NagD (HAD superfamily)